MITIRYCLPSLLAFLFSVSTLWAGSNEGFRFYFSPLDVRNPVVGQSVSLSIEVELIKAGKQSQIEISYNPQYIGNVQISPGSFIPVRLPLPAAPDTLSDELVVQAYGLSGSDTVSGSGTLYTIDLDVVGAIPVEGTMLSFTKIRVGSSSADFDEQIFDTGQFGVRLKKYFPNAISDLETTRGRDFARLNWRTKQIGYTDTVRVRAEGDSLWQIFTNPLAEKITKRKLSAINALNKMQVNLNKVSNEAVRTALQSLDSFVDFDTTDPFINSVRNINNKLASRRHVVTLNNLEPDTAYEFSVRSYGISGGRSSLFTGFFNTRRGVDKRPLKIERFDVQASSSTAVINCAL